MASVNIEFTAFLDARFSYLGKLTGLSRFDAFGRMAAIWAHCIDQNRNMLPSVLIDALVEMDGYAENVIMAGLAERVDEADVRIKGTEGRIEWLEKARTRQKAATKAAAERHKRKHLEINPISDPILDPKSAPTLASSSASTSTSASALRKRKSVAPSESTVLWYHYQEQLKAKTGADAVHEGAKTNTICSKLVKTHTLEVAKRMVDAFLGDSSDFVRNKSHPLGLLLNQQQTYLNQARSTPGLTPVKLI